METEFDHMAKKGLNTEKCLTQVNPFDKPKHFLFFFLVVKTFPGSFIFINTINYDEPLPPPVSFLILQPKFQSRFEMLNFYDRFYSHKMCLE